MKYLGKFVLFFLLSYGILLYIFSNESMRLRMNKLYAKSVHSIVSLGLPSAHIETQEVFLPNGKVDPDKVFLVYGNPKTINHEMAEARRNKLTEVKISTFSTQFYFFELFTVPLLFLLCLFIATPMSLRNKIVFAALSGAILFLLINAKTILYTLSVIAESQIGIYELSQSGFNTLNRIISLTSLGFSIILAFFLWLIFGFRKSEFADYFTSLIQSVYQK